jgi:hypothetical protein
MWLSLKISFLSSGVRAVGWHFIWHLSVFHSAWVPLLLVFSALSWSDSTAVAVMGMVPASAINPNTMLKKFLETAKSLTMCFSEKQPHIFARASARLWLQAYAQWDGPSGSVPASFPLYPARQMGDRRHPDVREPTVTNDTHHLSNSSTKISAQQHARRQRYQPRPFVAALGDNRTPVSDMGFAANLCSSTAYMRSSQGPRMGCRTIR